jgi:hypothetical protein
MKEVEKKTKYAVPAELVSFFAHPPIRTGEHRYGYEQVRNGVIESFEPGNQFEWLLVLDLANLTWEIRSLGKDKADLVSLTRKEALCMILEAHLDDEPQERRSIAHNRAANYFTGEGHEWVIDFLSKHGLREDAIASQAAALRLPELEIIDRQLARARLSRMAIVRDLFDLRVAGFWKRPDGLLAIVDASLVPLDQPADQSTFAP